MNFTALICLLSIFLTGLVAGFFSISKLGYSPVKQKVGAKIYLTFEQATGKTLGRLMPILMILAALTTAWMTVAAYGSQPAFLFCLVSLVLMAVAIIATLILNVPVNKRVAKADPDKPYAAWKTDLDRWEIGHTIRAIAFLLAFVCQLLAIFYS